MLKMNIVEIAKCYEQNTGVSRAYPIKGLETLNLYYGVINRMIEGGICHLGDISLGIKVHDIIIEEYTDLELIQSRDGGYGLTNLGAECLDVWKRHYTNTYGFHPDEIISAWDAAPNALFYNTTWVDHEQITVLMRNSKAAFERLFNDLHSGVPVYQAERQLQHCPIANHTSVVMPCYEGHMVTYNPVLVPTQTGFDNILIAAAYRGVKLDGYLD